MSQTTKEEIGQQVSQLCEKFNMDPLTAIGILEQSLEWHQVATANCVHPGPYAEKIEECSISNEVSEWPNWTEALIPKDSKFELYSFKDGRKIAKLLNHRSLVLLAKNISDLA